MFATAITTLSSTQSVCADEIKKSAILSRRIFQGLMIAASKVPLDVIQTQGMLGVNALRKGLY